MLICSNPSCKHPISGKLKVCPECGTALLPIERVADYRIFACVADTRTASIYRAQKEGESNAVCLRLYDEDVRLTAQEQVRLRQRFDLLRTMPDERFIHTLDFGYDDAAGRWYRVTPWLQDVKAWGDLKSESLYRNPERKRQWLDLALDLAESFSELHRKGWIIPDFMLEDCLLYRTSEGRLRVRLDATLASALGPDSGREKVRGHHPDFVPGRLLSEQSDIWTLGALLVSMLLGPAGYEDPEAALDAMCAKRLPMLIHPKLGQLLRQMVALDPQERPHDMEAVCETLRAFDAADIAEWSAHERDPWQRNVLMRRVVAIFTCAAVMIASLIGVLFHRQEQQTEATANQIQQNDVEHRAQAVLEHYGPSVAFVLTEVWIEMNEQKQSVAIASGTAFLISEDGYLLSNRHVVAPWLTGEIAEHVNAMIVRLRAQQKTFRLGASHWLWFDGTEAFRNVYAAAKEDQRIEDTYRLDTAYTDTGKSPHLRVIGVMPRPADPADYLASTLENDVALLKVDVPPSSVRPIPLGVRQPRRGEGVFALGYSQGREAIPGTRAQARASRGSATGLIGDVMTTDADLQPGNSGGPILDFDGYAIGIASAIYHAKGGSESSMGRVLPIETARQFYDAARTGRPMWNGLLDAAFEPELRAAKKAAEQGKWEVVRALAQIKGVNTNPDVALRAAIYSMDKAGFTPDGRKALESVLAMTPECPFAALLLYWDAWRRGVSASDRPCRQALLEAAWWSPFEYYGHVARILNGGVDIDAALDEAESQAEVALLCWAAGTAEARAGYQKQAAALLNQGLSACSPEDPLMHDLLVASLWFECGERPLPKGRTQSMPKGPSRLDALQKAFDTLVAGDFKRAFVLLEDYFSTARRESANTLGMKLFFCQLEGFHHSLSAEQQALQRYRQEIHNTWYQRIADCLMGNADPDITLASVAGKRPETITLAVALGLQAEILGDNSRALDYYRAALDTGQQNWFEYRFAQARREALKK